MGLKRQNGRLYYYSNRREGSRVISEYGGGGPLAILSEYRDRIQREQQQREREREIAYAKSMLEIESQFDELDRFVDLVVKAFYLSEGYHLHKRQWRKRRIAPSTNSDGGNTEMMTISKPKPNAAALPDSNALEQELGRLVVEACQDQKKVSAVRSFLAQHTSIFDHLSMLGPTLQKTVLTKMFGDNETTILLAEGEYRAMIARLASEGSTPVERLLIDRIGMCWLRVNYAELALTNAETFKQQEANDKALGRAQRKFLSAIETLCKARVVIARGEAAEAYAQIAKMKAAKRERELMAEAREDESGSKRSERVVKLVTGKNS